MNMLPFRIMRADIVCILSTKWDQTDDKCRNEKLIFLWHFSKADV